MKVKHFFRSSTGTLNWVIQAPIVIRGIQMSVATSDSSGGDFHHQAIVSFGTDAAVPNANELNDRVLCVCAVAGDFQSASGYAQGHSQTSIGGLDIEAMPFEVISMRVNSVTGTIAGGRFSAAIFYDQVRGGEL